MFGLASQRASGNAPTNLVGRKIVLTGSGTGTYQVDFSDAVNFADVSPLDNTITNYVGTYVYGRSGTNAGSLDLNYSGAPTNSVQFRFVAPNFSLYSDLFSPLGTAVFK